jgi:hypothetical protein
VLLQDLDQLPQSGHQIQGQLGGFSGHGG